MISEDHGRVGSVQIDRKEGNSNRERNVEARHVAQNKKRESVKKAQKSA